MTKFIIAAICVAIFFHCGQSPVEAQTSDTLPANITQLSQNIACLISMVPELCDAVVVYGTQNQQQMIETVNDLLSEAIQQADNLTAKSGVDTSSCPNVTSSLTPDAESIKSSLTTCINNGIFAAQSLNNTLMATYTEYAVTLTNIQSLANSCWSFWGTNLQGITSCLIYPITLFTTLFATMTANNDIILVGNEPFNDFSSQLSLIENCTTTYINQITSFQAEITTFMEILQQYITNMGGTVL